MKIGYPCINHQLDCSTNHTFRLASYSEQKLIEAVTKNLNDLQTILAFNVKHGLLFFRIGSQFVPFASHPVCNFNWQQYFVKDFRIIGDYIKKYSLRISMHPDQFVILNSLSPEVIIRSISELRYHCELLDAMRLDTSAKVQIHVGGIYGDKVLALVRFIEHYINLPSLIKKRLVIENDERLFSVEDCLKIHQETGIPVLWDNFHHSLLNNGETVRQAATSCAKTWQKQDGIMMVDYSSQQAEGRAGKHTEHIDLKLFQIFLENTRGMNFDIMLEIKDKEKSALLAKKFL